MARSSHRSPSPPWWVALPRPLDGLAAIDRLARTLPNLERDPRFRRGEVELSLERTRALMGALRDPLAGIPVLHVAGSKGKGSVCLLAEALLRAHGWRTGTYLSPHVDFWNERIQLEGRPIAPRAMGRALQQVVDAARRARLGAPTLFEALTVAAFLAFQEARVDVAIVEVGIGGLRDATNVVRSKVAVVTAIEREHVAILGKTLDSIAAQKAGIVKRGAVAISGVPATRREAAMVRAAAQRVGAPLLEWGREVTLRMRGERLTVTAGMRRWAGVPAPPGGRFAARNAALALAAVAELHPKLDPAAIAEAFRTVRLPGRLERVAEAPPTWRDGAHTPRSLRAVVEDVARLSGVPPVLVFALKRDKPLARCLKAVAAACGPVIATRLPDGACFDPKEIVAAARPLGIMARPVAEPAAALARARRLAGRHGAVLVTGSFWLAGAVPRLLRRPA